MWELDHEEDWALKNWCFWTVVLEKTLESPLDSKEIQPIHPKGNQLWIFIGRTDAEAEAPILWPEGLTHWKRPWCWERLKAGGEGGGRGWDGWMASPARWTWVWASSGSWWWTERPSVLQSIGSQRVRHYWRTELKDHIPKQNRSDLCITLHYPIHCSQVESEQMCTTSFLFTKVDPGWLKDDDKDKSRELFSLGEV